MPDDSKRLDDIVSGLLQGRRLRIGPRDAADRKAIIAAVQLAAAREGYPRMSPAFRRRLAETLGETPREGWVSRRTALVGGLGAAAGAIAGLGASRLGGLVAPGPAREPAPATGFRSAVVDPRPGRWVDVAALADLPEGQGFRVQAGAVGAYLFRSGSNVTAVSAICSHLPCELDWVSARGVLNCPCHNAAFKPSGESLSPNYPLPSLAAVQVRVVSGRVEVMGT
jgi:nitrite reductase/ring-hydroxylating ferredoxin subunit